MNNRYPFVFIDVDTQKDLVEHFGKRAIPDCPEIRENLMELMSFAVRNKIPILSPVIRAKSLNYCEAGTSGAEKVLDTECEGFDVVEESNIHDFIAGKIPQMLFPHDKIDPFTNPLLIKCLNEIQPENIVVFGVPLEEAVTYVVKNLAEKTDAKIWLIRDAVKGFAQTEPIITELKRERGVSLMSARNTLKYLAEIAY